MPSHARAPREDNCANKLNEICTDKSQDIECEECDSFQAYSTQHMDTACSRWVEKINAHVCTGIMA